MFIKELKDYLETFSETTNVLIYTSVSGESRQLLMCDLDVNHDRNIVIDGEHAVVPVKKTVEIDMKRR